jgi:uncharacterized protein YndB with AHSA1/START domain
MSKTTYIYVIYIAATPEKIWDALSDKDLTSQYWNSHNLSDWKVGSQWEHRQSDKLDNLRIIGKVLETDRPRRLVVTWAFPAEQGNPEKISRVTYQIEPVSGPNEHSLVAGSTRLTITHDELEPDSAMLKGISGGWPIVLSGLKTLLETGKPLSTKI